MTFLELDIFRYEDLLTQVDSQSRIKYFIVGLLLKSSDPPRLLKFSRVIFLEEWDILPEYKVARG